MNKTSYVKNIFDVLHKIYKDGAFSQIRLNEELKNSPENASLITKVVYGVLDNSLYLDYYLSCLAPKKPKPQICLILKIGIYMVNFLQLPHYAVVNNLVELTKAIGKKQLSGFVNATLKNAITYKMQLPKDNALALSIESSYPKWFIDCIISQYGETTAREIVLCKLTEDTHIRRSNTISAKAFERVLQEHKVDFKPSPLENGYYVSHSTMKNSSVAKKLYTNQSISSMLVCLALSPLKDACILDACAAPGGKSVYLAEIANEGKIISCDLHEHRVALIRRYAERMQIGNVEECLMDSTIFNLAYKNKFDSVLLDVPCSGFGVAQSKPDIKLNKKLEDIAKIAETQKAILENCSQYVKCGGSIVYSTCTILQQENQDIINAFLKEHHNFLLQEIKLPITPKYNCGQFVQLLPNLDSMEGFFIAKLERVK